MNKKLKVIKRELEKEFKNEPNKNKIIGFTLGIIVKNLPELKQCTE